MTRVAALAALAVTACATPSPPPTVDHPAPLHPDPSLCAPVAHTPEIPQGSGIPRPVTDEERTATAAFLRWAHDLFETARENEGRAEMGRRSCSPS